MPLARGFFRFAIATILLATGLGKLLDVPGFAEVLRTYQFLPDWALRPTAAGFVLVELRLSEWLFSGKRLAAAALAASWLHAAFVVWVTVTYLRGIHVPNCGCFGVFLARPLTRGTIVEDLVMLAACLILYALAKGVPHARSVTAHSDDVLTEGLGLSPVSRGGRRQSGDRAKGKRAAVGARHRGGSGDR